MELRRLKEHETGIASKLLPQRWHSNLPGLFAEYGEDSHFYPLAAIEDGSLAGFGQALIFDKTAWLGNIMVNQSFRNKGLGSRLTEKLMDYCYSKKIDSIQLTATGAAESIYKRLGFIEDSLYLFYRGVYEGDINGKILPIEDNDFRSVLNINYRVTGEVKDSILTGYLASGYKYLDRYNNISGFYLPDYGNGMILAMDDVSGMELLKFKHHNSETMSVISEENEAGVTFLEEINFKKVSKSTRMYHGEYTEWYPNMTFSRGSSYAG